VTKDIYVHYCDSKKAFGHELVLYSLLTITDEKDYPWNMYRVNNEKLYDNIAHVGAKPLVGGNSKNENESENEPGLKTEIVFFHKGKQILDVGEYIESRTSRKKIPTIGKLLSVLGETTFHYEIFTELEVCEKATLSWLSGHYIDDYFGYSTSCLEVYRKKGKQYLSVSIEFDRIGVHCYTFDDDGHEERATTKNMKKYHDGNLLSKEGKLRVPEVFRDHVYPEDPTGIDNHLDSVKVTFKFSHVDDCELSNIFEFIEIERESKTDTEEFVNYVSNFLSAKDYNIYGTKFNLGLDGKFFDVRGYPTPSFPQGYIFCKINTFSGKIFAPSYKRKVLGYIHKQKSWKRCVEQLFQVLDLPEFPKTTVISLKGKKNEWGSQLENCPTDVVYIGRRFTMGGWDLKESPFCNPFKVTEDLPREEAIEKYREHINKKIEKDPLLKNELASYKGKKLACWCFPEECHGDILCEIIENM
jgi:NAD-dependent dihydropyrimidine dehydrogenase PreA subunit